MRIKEWILRLWRWIEGLHTGAWIWEHTTSFHIATSLIYGSGVAIAGAFMDNWLAVFIGAPVAGFFILLIWVLAIRIKNPTPGFDIYLWTNQPIYSVWVAACLWVNYRPWPSIPVDSPAWPSLQMIKSAIEAREIQTLTGEIGMKARITREELIKLAYIRNERPKFLFPS